MNQNYTKFNKPETVLVLGSSALKIGEAGEFDYSGSQAIKALKEEGIRTILINPNVATIQTSENFADEVYFTPVTPKFVEEVIKKERPDSIMLGFGGQTALNCGIELYQNKVFEKYNIQILGAPIESVLDTEDRKRFVKRLDEIGIKTARGMTATNVEEALKIGAEIQYPVMIRIAFALGGLGSGICRTEKELREASEKAFAHTDQILIEEYLTGWKEIEYEVVRDNADNCVTVCNMENLDPMGIHTGESIVVAPSQTLNDHEYHLLREIAIKVVRHLKIVGECNIQYAFSPKSSDYRVIEVNARLSRSSALASKATGYPLACVATKLALGKNLTEIKNSVTQVTMACFEPSLDYIVVKAPRWDLKKFRGVSERIGSAMKSVGEVMSIGRKFEEALQKALRMLETGADGVLLNKGFRFKDIKKSLAEPTERRIFAIAEAIKAGISIDEIHEITHITKWFIEKIAVLVAIEKELCAENLDSITEDLLLRAKKFGFSDKQISKALESTEKDVRKKRKEYNLRPFVKQIDTLAAEYPAATNYLYLTYNGSEDDVDFGQEGNVLILGPGAYRIGSSVEFDWCCVNAARTLRSLGYRTLMVNHNPETVSTDYDECDRLFFEELSFETVADIYELEQPMGILLAMGGQIPNKLAMPCYEAGMRVLGTSPQDIDRAENRHIFSALLEKINIPQPDWKELTSLDETFAFADRVGFPVIIRPSYVLSGAAMAVAGNNTELEGYLKKAVDISPDHPVVISKFIENAKEIDIDAVARDGELVCYAVSEHVENAGVHSGDATLVLPPQRTYLETMRRIRTITATIAKEMAINGPMNIQFIAINNEVMVIECNLRASRSFPFVSKVLKKNFIEIATRVIMGRPVPEIDKSVFDLDYVGVKAPQFSFSRLQGADPTLGVEMASTGEVACLGADFEEAFLKALISVGYKLPIKSVLLSSGPIESKAAFKTGAKMMASQGIKFYATGGTAEFLKNEGIDTELVYWPLDKKSPNAIELLKSGEIDLVINIPKDFNEEELTNDYMIRRTAVDFGVPLLTNVQLAQRLAEAMNKYTIDDLKVNSWNTYV